MGQYTIVLDSAVFEKNAGTYQVESLDLLRIRLAELPAIAKLEQMSQTGVFAKALVASAERPVEDAAQMATHPMDTVTGLPSGVGEFFGRVGLGANTLYTTATNSSENGGQRATQTAEGPAASRSLLWVMIRTGAIWPNSLRSILTPPTRSLRRS